VALLEEFVAGPMGEGCRIRRGADLAAPLRSGGALAALYSPHDLRVESRDAIPRLAAKLEGALGVTFGRCVVVQSVEAGVVRTTAGVFRAPRIIVCPGADVATLFPEAFGRRNVTPCKLLMLRLADPGWRLPAAVMSDLGLARYRGYAYFPRLPALRTRLAAEQAEELAHGVHLIVVQGADGSLVVGNSHHYGPTPDPFQPEHVDALMLREAQAVLDLPAPRVVERWTGPYPSGAEGAFFEAVAPGVRLVSVTSGTGASTAFGLAEEVLADLEANPSPSASRPSSSTGRARCSITARARRWAPSSRRSRSSASASQWLTRAARWAWPSAITSAWSARARPSRRHHARHRGATSATTRSMRSSPCSSR
jgi:FAD dependent oxidoreductase TIGR03364